VKHVFKWYLVVDFTEQKSLQKMNERIPEALLVSLRNAAESIARLGGDSTLAYYKRSFELEHKDDNSPVTNADKQAERIIRDEIRKRYPDHGIIGEEYGSEGSEREIVWVVDPIDGTQSFIHGIPFYTTLIGILIHGRPEVGIIYAPALGEMMTAATGQGATLNGAAVHSRNCNDLALATFLTTDTMNIRKHGFQKSYDSLLSAVRLHRTWGDAYGHLMVAAGRADLMFDPVLSIWDAAALMPVLTESGAHFSDVYGKRTIETGNALSCSTGLRETVLEIFNPISQA